MAELDTLPSKFLSLELPSMEDLGFDPTKELNPETLKNLRLVRDDPPEDAKRPDVFERMNKKCVPVAETIVDVKAFLDDGGISIEEAQRQVKENFRKYKIVEANLIQQKAKMLQNVPEFRQGRELLTTLKAAVEDPAYEWPMVVRYPLAEQVYATSLVDKVEYITIVLGANTMVDVTIAEAEQIYNKNLTDIERIAADLTEEIDFVKDQITTSEVNQAHLYNYHIQLKKAEVGIA